MDDTADRLPVARKVKTLFWIGETVWLKLRESNEPGMIVESTVMLPGGIRHTVTWEDGDYSDHYEAELSADWIPDYARGKDAAGEGMVT